MKTNGSCHCQKVRWTYEAAIESATACNCTSCRRYGALWAYGNLDEVNKVSGATSVYMRGKAIEYHFCSSCGCLTHYAGTKRDENGKQRFAVNLRMTDEPESIMNLRIDHFDGLDSFDDLPSDGACIKNLWF